jgi:hypothetical protein
MAVRGKFVVTVNAPQPYGIGNLIVLEPRYDPDLPEDQRYMSATPSGKVELRVDNPAALAEFAVGQAFYLDFTPVIVKEG